MPKVTFVSHPTNNPSALYGTTFVRLYDTSGRQVLSDEFVVGVQDIDLKILEIPAGEYLAWVRADGARFPWRVPVYVEEVDPYQVVTFQGDGTFRPEAHHAVLVYGWVKSIAPNVRTGKLPVSHNTTIYGGFSRTPYYQQHDIVFKLLKDGPQGDGVLLESDHLRVGFDRNGYFEAELRPDSVYEVVIPGCTPKKIKTQTSGVSDVRPLIQGGARTHLYSLG